MTDWPDDAAVEAIISALGSHEVYRAHPKSARGIAQRKRVRSILQAAGPPPNEWRTIESAPMDCTPFLAVVDGRVRTVQWGRTSHLPINGFCLADQGVEDFDLCHPTAWQPLPRGIGGTP